MITDGSTHVDVLRIRVGVIAVLRGVHRLVPGVIAILGLLGLRCQSNSVLVEFVGTQRSLLLLSHPVTRCPMGVRHVALRIVHALAVHVGGSSLDMRCADVDLCPI